MKLDKGKKGNKNKTEYEQFENKKRNLMEKKTSLLVYINWLFYSKFAVYDQEQAENGRVFHEDFKSRIVQYLLSLS